MRIFWGELRRYLRPLTLAVMGILLLGEIWAFDDPYRKPSYRDWGIMEVAYQKRFGDTIDSVELEQLRQDYADLCAELDELIETYMGEYDIHRFADYRLLKRGAELGQDSEEYRTAAERWGADNLAALYDQCDSLFCGPLKEQAWQEQDLCAIIEQAEPVVNNGHEYSLGDEGPFTDYYNGRYELLIYVDIAVMVIWYVMRGKTAGIQPMQFVSRRGRALLPVRLGAGLAVAGMVNLVIDTVFFFAYFYNGDERHYLLHCPIQTSTGDSPYYLNLTVGQYALLNFAQVLLLSLALTGALFLIAQHSQNYVSAIAKAVPAVVLLNCYSSWRSFGLTNCLYKGNHAVWEYPVRLVLPLIAVLGTMILFWCRVRKADDVN